MPARGSAGSKIEGRTTKQGFNGQGVALVTANVFPKKVNPS